MSEKQTVEAGNSLPPPLGSALRLLRAASRLDVWLRDHVGDRPVRLQCSDVATADALACLLAELRSQVRACLERGVDCAYAEQRR